ncbi:MAG TPA: DUF4229 domain-containing protein [Gaiellales bacterium]|nr:DUF4229 domain-containing protein [Gaiellales bacterium]
MQGSAARSVVAYNLGRIGLFVACAVLGYVAGLRGLALLAAALLISGILSWFLLARQRAAMAEALGGAVSRSRSKLASRTAAEDAYADALHADASQPGDASQPADVGQPGEVRQPGPSAAQPPIPAHQDVTRPDR